MKENNYKKSIFKSEQVSSQDEHKKHNQSIKIQEYAEDDSSSTRNNSVCKNCQKFEVLMRKMIKEKEQLLYEIKYKDIALQKREELMTHYATESQSLKHQILNLKNRISKLESQIEQQQPDYTARSFFSKNSQNILRSASINSAQKIETDEKTEKQIKQKELANQIQEAVRNLQKQQLSNKEVEQSKQIHSQQNNQNDKEIKIEDQTLKQNNQALQKQATFQKQDSTKNLYKLEVPNSQNKAFVDLSKGFPKVIKSNQSDKNKTVPNENSSFYNREQDKMFNYDKYEHFILKSNTEKKVQPYLQQQPSAYKNPTIKIKKRQRIAQSVSDITSAQRVMTSYTPTKFVERDQIQREQDAKIIINKMSTKNLEISQEQDSTNKIQQQTNVRPSSSICKLNNGHDSLNQQFTTENQKRPYSGTVIPENKNEKINFIQNQQNTQAKTTQGGSEINKGSQEKNKNQSIQNQVSTNNNLNVPQNNLYLQSPQQNQIQRSKSASSQNYKKSVQQNNQNVQDEQSKNNSEGQTQNLEQKNNKVDIKINNLPLEYTKSDSKDQNPDQVMNESQNLMTKSIRHSRHIQSGDQTNRNNALTPPTQRNSTTKNRNSSSQIAPQQVNKPAIKRNSFYATLETFQSDDHLDKNNDKQDSTIEEDYDEEEENKKNLNFTQAISRQSPCNSPQTRQLNSSGSTRNLKQNANFTITSSQNQNIQTPNRMLLSQRSPQRIPKKHQYRKLDDEENQIMFLTSEQDLKKAKKNPRNYWIGDFVEDPTQFFYKLSLQPVDQQVSFADSIQKLLTDYVISLDYGLMLKKSLESCIDVSKSLRFNEIMNNLHQQLIRNINCQKIFFYIYDEKTKELWSKKSDNSVIRIKPQRGLLKHLVTTLEKIKVDDIAYDPRFDPEIDSILHPDIKSLLLIPLLNYQNGLMGVVQIVNLNYKSKAKYIYDQMKVENIIRVSGNIISIGMIYEQNFLNNQRISRLLQNYVRMLEIEKLNELMAEAQEALIEIFGTQKCFVYLINSNNKLERFTKQYLENNQTLTEKRIYDENNNNKSAQNKKYIINSEEFEIRTGIIGLSITSKQEIEVMEQQQHPYFNPLTDIDTYLPTYTLPIISNNQVLGALQVSYLNTQLGKKVLKMDILYKEIMQNVCSLIGHCIEKLLKYNQEINFKLQEQRNFFENQIEQIKTKQLKTRSYSTKSVVSPVIQSKTSRGPIYNSQQQIQILNSQIKNKIQHHEKEQYNNSNLICNQSKQ
ncbi:GAF domain protein (macronuclear) [Tetrahymena thermophila SB210]|uniref:GAF domain protein n=1 Tax=Tetrahymena thermophila (strain SB210) TaxID=312017 RepID=I7M8G0_TETTS|nr:GAF domain protein [Tetrahymena thermophila SB210]EAR98009.2 GAF domain protein [Tetrahymena thermophila SB210]|eukprot:XP_001018254.2 GAF domain protein [Tetrahymena thermophila SB210]